MNKGAGSKKADSYAPSSTGAFLTGKEEIKCVVCLGNHPHEKCTTVKDSKERKNIANKYARCLRKGHHISDCRINIECSNCKGGYHQALCSTLGGGTNQEPVKSPNSMHVGAGNRVAL